MKKTLSKIGLIILVTLFSFRIAFFVQAETRALTISPTLIEKAMDPGQVQQEILKVRNDSNTKQTIQITVQNFLPKGETGEPVFLAPEEGDTPWSLADWIKVEERIFELEPQATKEVKFTISVPKDAEPGGKYAAIFAETELPRIEGAAVVGVRAKVGCLLLINISGEVIVRGDIKEFKTDKRVYYSPPVRFITRFENTGTTHVKPTGSIKIYSPTGRLSAEVLVNEKLANVLPQSIRAFESSWEPAFALGRYKAEVSLTYGDGKEAKSTTYFWMIPWAVIALVVLVIISCIIIGKTLDIVPQGARNELYRLRKRVLELETEKRLREELEKKKEK